MPEEFWDVPVSSAFPLRDGKGTIYEGGTRVPLIVIWPGKVKPGSKQMLWHKAPIFFQLSLICYHSKLPNGLEFDGTACDRYWKKAKNIGMKYSAIFHIKALQPHYKR